MSVNLEKSINLLLYEGNLDGLVIVEDSGWETGELYSASRTKVSDLLNTDACSKNGVYILLSDDRVYVGQSSFFSARVDRHLEDDLWWSRAVILTTKEDILTQEDTDYLEQCLIEKAEALGVLDANCKAEDETENVGNLMEESLNSYLEEALFLVKLIGCSAFIGNKHQPQIRKIGRAHV